MIGRGLPWFAVAGLGLLVVLLASEASARPLVRGGVVYPPRQRRKPKQLGPRLRGRG